MEVKYIGFCGPAGSGKTTVANAFRLSILGTDNASVVIPMAKPLKDMAKDCFGWNGEKDEKGRLLLQVLGTECGRMYGGDNFWLDRWVDGVEGYIHAYLNSTPPKTLYILCDDVRFDNEASKIKELGGTIVHVSGKYQFYKPSYFERVLLFLGIKKIHETERGISENLIDMRIENNYDDIASVQKELGENYASLFKTDS